MSVYSILLQNYAFSEDHRMKLNPTKCKEMLINFMNNRNFIVNPIVIGGKSIERVLTYKLLGVHISNDLKYQTANRLCHLSSFENFDFCNLIPQE